MVDRVKQLHDELVQFAPVRDGMREAMVNLLAAFNTISGAFLGKIACDSTSKYLAKASNNISEKIDHVAIREISHVCFNG